MTEALQRAAGSNSAGRAIFTGQNVLRVLLTYQPKPLDTQSAVFYLI